MAKTTKRSTSTKVTSQKDLRTLIEHCLSYEGKAATAMGNSRELVGEYVEKKNLHPAAFSQIKRLTKLGRRDPGALWLWLAYFDDYRAKLNIDKMAKEQTQLLPAGTEDDDTNVTRIAPRDVEEEAGAA